jgi:hypothetical protein
MHLEEFDAADAKVAVALEAPKRSLDVREGAPRDDLRVSAVHELGQSRSSSQTA